MNTEPRGNLRLAIYGKGGIGKSTIAANLAASFAVAGKSVLQVGCDPKHDSTRLLLGGRTATTVLEHLEKPRNQADLIRHRRRLMSPELRTADVVAAGTGVPMGLDRDAVVQKGFAGVCYVEAGGPRPGVGCAGRGIITTFELLGQLGVRPDDFDVVIYDVLGDVVCGGFGVPMRQEHANAILLVTSEEYMPLFAANNILRGIANYDGRRHRVAGLFLNRRSNDSSSILVERFAESVRLPVLGELLRSEVVQKADHLGQTVIEAFRDSIEAAAFTALAKHLTATWDERHAAAPLTDEELEQRVLGRGPARGAGSTTDQVFRRPVAARRTQGAPHRLAIYGKGGIGKSTVASNLAVSLARSGLRVLQVGCDPKHDSTRLILGGRRVRTVLEYLRDVTDASRKLEDVLHAGTSGVHGVEVGGPEPGVGCAGRGILSAFTLLAKLGLRDTDYDVIIYDVLGDVVCGGFAFPLRNGYADSVLLVTSEEYMPLYAANNILRGINGVVGVAPRLLGVFHSMRDNDADCTPLEHWTAAVGLPVVARLKRSDLIQQAEKAAMPVALFSPESREAKAFADLAARMMDSPQQFPAVALPDTELDRIVLGRSAPEPAEAPPPAEAGPTLPANDVSGFTRGLSDLQFCEFEQAPDEPFYYRKKPIRQPIWNCAFQSAVRTALRLRDAVVVAHAPRSCAYMCRVSIASQAASALKRRKESEPDLVSPNLVCTDMTVPDMIYGGTELLTETLKRVLANHPPVVFLATACPSAIIGDDIAEAIRQAQPTSPQTPIIPLRTDGNMTGGGMNGHLSAVFDGLLRMTEVAPDGPPAPLSVNLISNWDPRQSAAIRKILEDIGIGVNVSFSLGDRNARAADLRRLGRASLTLTGSTNFANLATAKHLRERYGTRMGSCAFPRSAREASLWLREIGAFFHIEDRVESYLQVRDAMYRQSIAACRQCLAGKRVAIFSMVQPIDWILDTMLDCGMEVAFWGITARQDNIPFSSQYWNAFPTEFCFHPQRRLDVLRDIQPDAVFVGMDNGLAKDYIILDTAGVSDDDVAFDSGEKAARRWARLLSARTREGWRDDFVPRDLRLNAIAGELMKKVPS
jgi:nitrogenase iron protein